MYQKNRVSSVCSVVPDSETPWTVADQTPLSMWFPRQEYYSALPFLPPRDLPDWGIKLASPELAGGFFTTEPPGKLSLVGQSTNCWPAALTRKPCAHYLVLDGPCLGKEASRRFFLASNLRLCCGKTKQKQPYKKQIEESGVKKSFEHRARWELTWLHGGGYATEFSKSALMSARCQALWQIEKKAG